MLFRQASALTWIAIVLLSSRLHLSNLHFSHTKYSKSQRLLSTVDSLVSFFDRMTHANSPGAPSLPQEGYGGNGNQKKGQRHVEGRGRAPVPSRCTQMRQGHGGCSKLCQKASTNGCQILHLHSGWKQVFPNETAPKMATGSRQVWKQPN